MRLRQTIFADAPFVNVTGPYSPELGPDGTVFLTLAWDGNECAVALPYAPHQLRELAGSLRRAARGLEAIAGGETLQAPCAVTSRATRASVVATLNEDAIDRLVADVTGGMEAVPE